MSRKFNEAMDFNNHTGQGIENNPDQSQSVNDEQLHRECSKYLHDLMNMQENSFVYANGGTTCFLSWGSVLRPILAVYTTLAPMKTKLEQLSSESRVLLGIRRRAA